MEGSSRRHVLQSSITRLGRSLMVLNTTSAWKVLCALSNGNIAPRGSDTSHGRAMSWEIPRLVRIRSVEKRLFTKELSKLHANYSMAACMDMHVKMK